MKILTIILCTINAGIAIKNKNHHSMFGWIIAIITWLVALVNVI